MSLHENLGIVEQPTDLLTLTPRYTQRALQIIEHAATGNSTTPDPKGVGRLAPAPVQGQPFALFMHYEESHVPLFAAPGYQNTSSRGAYGDMTGQLDGSMAVIVDALERYGLMNSTMIVVTSDNGAWIDPSSGFPGAEGTAENGGSNGPMRVSQRPRWAAPLPAAARPPPAAAPVPDPAIPSRVHHRRAARAPRGRAAW